MTEQNIFGGCHCGAVRFEGTVENAPELLDCNCSICARTGFLHLIVPHLFCKHCGVKSFYQPRSHPNGWSVNYHCVDDGHHVKPTIRKFDGRNWEKSRAGL